MHSLARRAGIINQKSTLANSMTSRDDILSSIRKHLPQSAEQPELQGDWIEFDDPVEQFITVLESVGGQGVRVNSIDEINDHLKTIEAYTKGEQVVSLVPNVGQPTLDLNTIDDPHDLAGVDFVIARGEFGVAENGAVWVTDRQINQRSIYFITQHMALVIPANEVVNNLHEAYAKLVFNGSFFGCYISGPSKTADIEQSLVIGAHGSRTQVVYLLDE